MTKVILVDSDALFALNSQKDANFKKAKQIAKSLTQKNFDFAISNFVLAETVTLLNYRIGHRKAVIFLTKLAKDQFPIITIDQDLENLTYKIFRKQTSKNVSVTDCANMAVLKRFGWETIFSFDKIYLKNKCKLAQPWKRLSDPGSDRILLTPRIMFSLTLDKTVNNC